MKPIEKIHLPKGSKNEELETKSRKEFIRLLDEKRFIIKDETTDNGIDFRIELIHDTNKLGFGFNFQLKSTSSIIKNLDGSYSKSIQTSNIEYLINNGQPAFYGFYIEKDQVFYYEHLNVIIKEFSKKKPDWEDQLSHTIRFSKILDENAINEIYSVSLNHGIMLRELTCRLAILTRTNNRSIIVNHDKSVTDDHEIHELIEELGSELINKSQWIKILELHSKTSNSLVKSPKYSLIVGMAEFYNGEIFNALHLFKDARRKETELTDLYKQYLNYFELTAKYAAGIAESEEVSKLLSKLNKSTSLFQQISIKEAKKEYYRTQQSDSSGAFNIFCDTLHSIIKDKSASSHIKLHCKCELLYHDRIRQNFDYIKEIASLNLFESLHGPNRDLRTITGQELSRNVNNWLEESNSFKGEITEKGNYFMLFLHKLYEAKALYQLEVFTDYVYVSDLLTAERNPNKEPNTEKILILITSVREALDFFKNVKFIDNVIASYSVLYELYSYIQENQKAVEILESLERLILDNDSPDMKRRFEYLKNNGTTHETFLEFVTKVKNNAKLAEGETLRIQEKLESYDLKEFVIDSGTDTYNMEFFPIGTYEFPRSQLEDIFEFLNIDSSAIKTIKSVLQLGAIPRINLFNDPILKEGYCNGIKDYAGIEDWRRILNFREFMFTNEFPKNRHYDH